MAAKGEIRFPEPSNSAWQVLLLDGQAGFSEQVLKATFGHQQASEFQGIPDMDDANVIKSARPECHQGRGDGLPVIGVGERNLP